MVKPKLWDWAGFIVDAITNQFLVEYRRRLFGDELFADLFGGRGRLSVPGSVVATVLVLQALEGCF